MPESTSEGFHVFPSEPDPASNSKTCKKTNLDRESIFNFGSCRSVRGHFLSKTIGTFQSHQWWLESELGSDFEIRKISGHGTESVFKNFRTGAEPDFETVTPAPLFCSYPIDFVSITKS